MFRTVTLALLLSLVLAACNDRGSIDELDPVKASGDHHRVIFENDAVRVLDVIIPAGETTALHLHALPSIFITLESADRFSKNKQFITVSSTERLGAGELPKIEWRGPGGMAVAVKNTDSVRFRAIRVELKGQE